MRQISEVQVEELRRIHAKLTEFLNSIEPPKAVVSPEIAAMVADLLSRGICLACKLPIPQGDRARRGQDSACYATTRARIRRGETTENEQIQQGKMTADAKPPGRRAKQDTARADANEVDRGLAKRQAEVEMSDQPEAKQRGRKKGE